MKLLNNLLLEISEYNYRLTLKTEDELGYNQKQIEEFNKTLG